MEDSGEQYLARVPVDGSPLEKAIGGPRWVGAFDVGSDGRIAAMVSEPQLPPEVFLAGDGALTRLTHTNDELLAGIRLGEVENVHFKSKDGTEIEGFIVKPPGFKTGVRYPTVLRIHGGPMEQYDFGFHFEGQLFAGAGYVVVMPNPRGSPGYGQDFCTAIWQAWGEKDFEDVMAAVDDAIARGYADPERLAVGGWSYGGMLTDHVITKTDRFKAAYTGASEALYITNYGHDEYQRWWEGRARAAVGEPGALREDVTLLPGRQGGHADPDRRRRAGLERAHRQLRAALPGPQAPRRHHRAGGLPGRVPRPPDPVLLQGHVRAVPRLVRDARQRGARAVEGFLMKLTALCACCCLLIGGPAAMAADRPTEERTRIPGFTAAASDHERGIEERLVDLLDPASTARHFRLLTEEPHPAGSDENLKLAHYVRDQFAAFGLEDVKMLRYDVLLPWPRKVAVSMVEPIEYTASLAEDGYPVDKDSYAVGASLTYLGMSASGDVTADVVYAHSGNPEDYDWLAGAGHRPPRQDRHRPLLEPVQLSRLQGLGGRASRRRGVDHLLRSDGRRLSQGGGLPRGTLGAGEPHPARRHHLRLHRSRRSLDPGLAVGGGGEEDHAGGGAVGAADPRRADVVAGRETDPRKPRRPGRTARTGRARCP